MYYTKGIKPGDVVEVSCWLSGKETEAHIESWKTSEVSSIAAQTEREKGVVIGEWAFEELLPEDDRVPEVPNHIKGPDVRLLYGSAKVVAFVPQFAPKDSRFIHDLAKKDLEKLRKITREAFIKQHKRLPSQAQVDDTINYLGPDTARKALDAIVSDNL